MEPKRLEEIMRLADQARENAQGDKLPVRLKTICDAHNVNVYFDHDMSDVEQRLGKEISGMILRDLENEENLEDVPKAVIFVNKNDGEQRKRFTIAHELGHFFLHEDNKLKVSYRGGQSHEETEANRFAAELLMPEDLVKQEYQKFPILVPREFARIFDVSAAAMEIRLEQLGLPYMKYLV